MFCFRLLVIMCSIVSLCHLLFILTAIEVISYFGDWFVSQTLLALFRILAPGIFHIQKFVNRAKKLYQLMGLFSGEGRVIAFWFAHKKDIKN